jgi:curli biogenesis system outer membrane secretion channel CsgG
MKISPSFTRLSLQTFTALAIASAALGVGSLTASAQTRPTQTSTQTKSTISVPSFKNETTWWWWRSNTARELADALSNELSATGHFTVVERQKLQEALSEQELADLGLVRQGTGAQKGQLTGAKYVVLGRVSAYEEGVSAESEGRRSGINLGIIRIGGDERKSSQEAYVAIDLRVVDTTTGEVVHSRTVEGRAKSESRSNSSDVSVLGVNVGRDNASQQKAPVGKALRAALVEATDYLSCVMYKKDTCIKEFQDKDTRRREGSRDVLKLE